MAPSSDVLISSIRGFNRLGLGGARRDLGLRGRVHERETTARRRTVRVLSGRIGWRCATELFCLNNSQPVVDDCSRELSVVCGGVEGPLP